VAAFIRDLVIRGMGHAGSSDRTPVKVDCRVFLDQVVAHTVPSRGRAHVIDAIHGFMSEFAHHHRALISGLNLGDLHNVAPRDGFADATTTARALFDNAIEAFLRRGWWRLHGCRSVKLILRLGGSMASQTLKKIRHVL
jgi:hypothetical protein